jgi:hypothetical protein
MKIVQVTSFKALIRIYVSVYERVLILLYQIPSTLFDNLF